MRDEDDRWAKGDREFEVDGEMGGGFAASFIATAVDNGQIDNVMGAMFRLQDVFEQRSLRGLSTRSSHQGQ